MPFNTCTSTVPVRFCNIDQIMKFFLAFAIFLIFGQTFALKPKKQAEYNYGEVLGLSNLFYEAQRSGKLPADNRVPWRRDTFLNDGADVGLDLSGGYFDAGDHVKFGFPAASSATIIGWGLLDYKDGYTAAGEYQNGLSNLKWFLDYMMKTHPSPNVIYAQVGDGNADHTFWGRPEDYPSNIARPSTQINTTSPGTDLASEYAAAFAVGSMVFKDVNVPYANECLRHAKECYDFAINYRGKYSDAVGSDFYGSTRFEDEMLVGALWMYRATMNQSYLVDANSFWAEFYLNYNPHQISWDDKIAVGQIMLAMLSKNETYVNEAKEFCSWLRNEAPRTPKGMVYLGQWGSLRTIATSVFGCLQAAEAGIDPVENRALAKEQMDYILGSSGRSYVVGYGNNPPRRPHHRASSCPTIPTVCNSDVAYNSPDPNPQTLFGALVGGPDDKDFYEDSRDDYVKNEVALDYNAGFQSALAALNSLKLRGLL